MSKVRGKEHRALSTCPTSTSRHSKSAGTDPPPRPSPPQPPPQQAKCKNDAALLCFCLECSFAQLHNQICAAGSSFCRSYDPTGETGGHELQNLRHREYQDIGNGKSCSAVRVRGGKVATRLQTSGTASVRVFALAAGLFNLFVEFLSAVPEGCHGDRSCCSWKLPPGLHNIYKQPLALSLSRERVQLTLLCI